MLYRRLSDILEHDERMLTPELYERNRRVYAGIVDSGFIVRTNTGELDWVKESNLNSRVMEHIDVVLQKTYIVRVRLPWTAADGETIVSPEQYNKIRDRARVIDVFLRVKEKNTNKTFMLIDTVEFEANPNRYEVLEIRYLVGPIQTRNNITNIVDRNNIRTMPDL